MLLAVLLTTISDYFAKQVEATKLAKYGIAWYKMTEILQRDCMCGVRLNDVEQGKTEGYCDVFMNVDQF